MNAPPRSSVAPAALTALATVTICSSLSTEQGPAIIWNKPCPMVTPPQSTIVSCGDDDVWGFPALAMRDTTIARGDRICQFRVMRKMDKPELVTVEHLDNASRGGFGSTGTR